MKIKNETIQVGDFEKIKKFTKEIFPKYKDLKDEEIKINPFTEGITNVCKNFTFLIFSISNHTFS